MTSYNLLREVVKICVIFKGCEKSVTQIKLAKTGGPTDFTVQCTSQIWWQQTKMYWLTRRRPSQLKSKLQTLCKLHETIGRDILAESVTWIWSLLIDLLMLRGVCRCGCFISRRATLSCAAPSHTTTTTTTHHHREVVLTLIGGPLITALWDEAWTLLDGLDPQLFWKASRSFTLCQSLSSRHRAAKRGRTDLISPGQRHPESSDHISSVWYLCGCRSSSSFFLSENHNQNRRLQTSQKTQQQKTTKQTKNAPTHVVK